MVVHVGCVKGKGTEDSGSGCLKILQNLQATTALYSNSPIQTYPAYSVDFMISFKVSQQPTI